jgi:hypothetical protein
MKGNWMREAWPLWDKGKFTQNLIAEHEWKRLLRPCQNRSAGGIVGLFTHNAHHWRH